MTSVATQRPVFVHIGLAKTGTTTLQRNYFARTPAINYLGKKNGDEDLNTETRALTRRRDGRFNVDSIRRLFEAHLEKPGTAVFSDEDMSVYKFLHPRQIGARIGKIFDEPRLIYVTRRPLNWIKSQYFFRLETYSLDCMGGINAWLDAHFAMTEVGSDISETRFAETFRAFHDAAGRPPFLMLPYELMVSDIDLFLAKIEEFMGLDGALRRLREDADKDPRKKRIGTLQANFIRTLSLYHTDFDDFMQHSKAFARYGSREMQRSFRALTDSRETRFEDWIKFYQSMQRRILTVTEHDPSVAALLSLFNDYEIRSDLAQRIADIEATETRTLQRDFGIDLSAFGYGAPAKESSLAPA